MKRVVFVVLMVCFLGVLPGCGSQNKMENGYYTAEMSDFSHGWKEYLCIMVKNDTIIYAEYNAKNPSGYIKSWDNSYMQNMLTVTGTYPNEYTRNYVSQLLASQTPGALDAISGASSSSETFKKLSIAVIGQAVKGDSATAIVE